MKRVTQNLIVGMIALSISGATVFAGSSCQRRGPCPDYRRPAPPRGAYPGPSRDWRQVPTDDAVGDENGFEDEVIADENAADEISPDSQLSREVQMQHPLTFEWITVKTFDDGEQAETYRDDIEQRYWVLYQAAASSEMQVLEASDQSDAQSKADTLRQAGLAVERLQPVEARVVDMPLLSLLGESPVLSAAPVPLPAAGVEQAAPSAVSNELEPLLGLWEAATQDAEGNVRRLLLDLHADGLAVLTVPTAGGSEARIERPFMIEDGEFKLVDEQSELVLGAVIEATAEQVVLERAEGRITLTRP